MTSPYPRTSSRLSHLWNASVHQNVPAVYNAVPLYLQVLYSHRYYLHFLIWKSQNIWSYNASVFCEFVISQSSRVFKSASRCDAMMVAWLFRTSLSSDTTDHTPHHFFLTVLYTNTAWTKTKIMTTILFDVKPGGCCQKRQKWRYFYSLQLWLELRWYWLRCLFRGPTTGHKSHNNNSLLRSPWIQRPYSILHNLLWLQSQHHCLHGIQHNVLLWLILILLHQQRRHPSLPQLRYQL